MGTFKIDTTSEPGVLRFELHGKMSADEVDTFCKAHNAAVDSYGDKDYVVFGDLSDMLTLDPEPAERMEASKRHSASKKNFRGSAILVSNAMVALQHRRTSTSSGVIATEILSSDLESCREHLRRIRATVFKKS